LSSPGCTVARFCTYRHLIRSYVHIHKRACVQHQAAST
jgi:hypothetical protein